MAREFKYAELSNNQIEFLKQYKPEDSCFTTTLEMKKIISKLGLDEGHDVEYLRSIRNSVVRFYSNLLESNFDFMSSLQSVTAVIDHQMYRVNPASV